VTDKNFHPLSHTCLVRSIITENLVTLSFTVSEKNAGQQNQQFGHIDRPEVIVEKMKKRNKNKNKKNEWAYFYFE
jgi:hypothetical protein